MEKVFSIVIIVTIVEMILSTIWNKIYFIVGIPIFVHEIPIKFIGSDRNSALAIEYAMPDTKYAPMKFRQLSRNTIAFRESNWNGFFKNSYTPVMHGNLQYTERGNIKVTGLVNWFIIVFSFLFFYLSFRWSDENPIIFVFPLFLVVVLSWNICTQKKRFINIAEIASGKIDHT